MKFRMMTYNIHKGMSSLGRENVLERIREQIRDLDVDVVFLQEVLGAHRDHDEMLERQFEYLADQVWDYAVYGKNAVYEKGHHGNAILSKFEFVEWENIDISVMPMQKRGLLHGVIRLKTGEKIHVISLHFDLFEHGRRQQIELLCERIQVKVPLNEPLIVAGDFNDWLGRSTQILSSRLEMQEAFFEAHQKHAATFPAWFPLLQLDRVYYRGLRLVQCQRLDLKNWKALSDHVPLLSEFELK